MDFTLCGAPHYVGSGGHDIGGGCVARAWRRVISKPKVHRQLLFVRFFRIFPPQKTNFFQFVRYNQR